MQNQALEDIKKYAAQRLQREYGYCGIADAPNMAFLNSGGESENITIQLKCEMQEQDEPDQQIAVTAA